MIAVNGSAGQTKKQNHGQQEEDGRPTAAALLEMLDRQEFKCALTGRSLTPQTASVDHIDPLSAGGENLISNIHIVHCDVNQAKGAMSLSDFVAMCKEVADKFN